MDKKKIEIIITGILIIVLIFAVYWSVKSLKKHFKKEDMAYMNEDVFKQLDLVAPVSSTVRTRLKEKYKAIEWARDPFSEYTPRRSVGFLKLEGIVWDVDNPYVIINGEVIKEGERISKYEVIKIEQNQVTVSDGIEIFILRL